MKKRFREETGLDIKLKKRIRKSGYRDEEIRSDPTYFPRHPLNELPVPKNFTATAHRIYGGRVLASFMRGSVLTPDALKTLAEFGRLQGVRLMVRIVQMKTSEFNEDETNRKIQELHGDYVTPMSNIVWRPFDYFNRPNYWNMLLTNWKANGPGLWRTIEALREHTWTSDELEASNSEGWFEIWAGHESYINTGIIFSALQPTINERGRRDNSAQAAFTSVSISSMDLKFAQIYQDKDLASHRSQRIEQCLLHSLKQAGIPIEKLQAIATSILSSGTKFVTQTDLKLVSDYLQLPLAISRVNKNGGANCSRIVRKIINKDISNQKAIELGIIDNHLFHNRNISTNKQELKLSLSKETKRISLKNKRYPKPAIWVINNLKKLGAFKCFTSEQLSRGAPEDDDFQEVGDLFLEGKQNLTQETLERDQRLFDFKEKKTKKDLFFFAADCESYTFKGEKAHELCLIGVTYIQDPSDWKSQEIKMWDNSQHPVDSMLYYIWSKVYSESMMNMDNEEEDDIDLNDPFIAQDQAVQQGYISSKRKKEKGRLTAIVYFHNLRYDRAVLQQHLKPFDILESDNSIYFMKIIYRDITIEFRDSFKHLDMSIKMMSKAFDLPAEINKKEIGIAYDYFDRSNLDAETSIEYYLFHCREKVDKEEFITALRENDIKITWHEEHETYIFNPWDLYRFYLFFDVLTLSASLFKYASCGKQMASDYLEDIDNIEHFNPLSFLTKSSFSRYLSSVGGTFDDSYEYCGLLRAFIMQSLRGGRVTAHPEFVGRQIEANENGILYFDGVSLYPSAIKAFCQEYGGFPTGPAHLLPPSPNLKNPKYFYYVVTIRITNIPKKMRYAVPIIALRNPKAGTVDYIQDLPENKPFIVTVGKVDLEDYIQFHNIKFTVIEGVYWSTTDHPNNTWGTMMDFLFESRLQYKAQRNSAMSNMLKLCMNSQYGSTIVKTHNTKNTLLDKSRADIDSAIYNIFHSIIEMYDIGQVLQVKRTQLDISHNSCLFGTIVVSMARRLMNRVMWAMEHTQTHCLYTDTDSLMFDAGKLDDITRYYEREYKTLLIGTQLGQFHSDFESVPGCDDSTVRSSKLYLVAKKIYCHELYGFDEKGNRIESRQFKCKGIPKKAIEAKALSLYPNDLNKGISTIYEALTPTEVDRVSLDEEDEDDEEQLFLEDKKVDRGLSILCNPNAARFVYQKNKSVSTPYTAFYRRVKRKPLFHDASLKKL
jgi:hypothetical protein